MEQGDGALRSGLTRPVHCITYWEQYLVTGSHDHTIRVWDKAGAGSWLCLGTIAAHTDIVSCVSVCNGRVISGSVDQKIMVHSIAQRDATLATLDARTGRVDALAVSGEKPFSASYDGTICEWALGTWERQRTI